MAYQLKYTSSKDTWSGSVKSGEEFIVDQNTNAPSGRALVTLLKKMGRDVKSYSDLGGGGLDVGDSSTFNEWTIVRLK
jgi:hypothetical protein